MEHELARWISRKSQSQNGEREVTKHPDRPEADFAPERWEWNTEAESIFFNYSKMENSSFWEEKHRMNILMIFIEYFCMTKRIPLKDLMGNIERMIILRVLAHFGGNQKRAAKFLGLKHTTLNEKIKRYNIFARKSPS